MNASAAIEIGLDRERQISVLADDRLVVVDGLALQCEFVPPPELRALHWLGGKAGGLTENKTGVSPAFTDFKIVRPYLDAWKQARAARDAREEIERVETEKRTTEARAALARASRAAALAAARDTAIALLAKSDVVATRCFKAGIPYPADWLAYDEALRAIARERPERIEDVAWPAPPTEPSGI